MSIKQYDNKLVRITDFLNQVFEGYCVYNNEEYNEVELGRKEESLQIINLIFYKDDIKKVEEIKEFSNPYGYFEESTLEDGIDSIDEVLYSESNEHIYRLLVCLEDYINLNKECILKDKKEIINLLRMLIRYNNDIQIKEKAKKIIERWNL
jgi:hypothetical protein